MSFQLPATTTQGATGFSFGLTSTPTAATAPAAKPPSFSFGAMGGGDAGSQKPLTFGAPTPAAAVAPTPTSAAPAAAAPAPAFGFGAQPVQAAAAPPPATTVALAAPPAALPSFNIKAPTTTATALALPKTAAPPTLGGVPSAPTSTAGGFANLTTATKTTDSAVVTNASQLSYNQLEEHINKWTLELEEQEKVFTDQATQINAWDKVLISNNQKILELNDAVQKVKSDQQTLEQELEFIATQHKELEESIMPLQKEFMKLPQVDVERSQTYLMVENLDTQLKQMSEDLKEIIDNLNEANKGQDNSDPIIQIGKILNAHMSSLQWIESSSAGITNKLEDITKMHDSFKRESERSFRSAYYN